MFAFGAEKGLAGNVVDETDRECRCVFATAGCEIRATLLVYAGNSSGMLGRTADGGLLIGPAGTVNARSGTVLVTVKTLMEDKTKGDDNVE